MTLVFFLSCLLVFTLEGLILFTIHSQIFFLFFFLSFSFFISCHSFHLVFSFLTNSNSNPNPTMRTRPLFSLSWIWLGLALVKAPPSVDSSKVFLPSESDFSNSNLQATSRDAGHGFLLARSQRLGAKVVPRKNDAPELASSFSSSSPSSLSPSSSSSDPVDSVEHIIHPLRPPSNLTTAGNSNPPSPPPDANANYTHEGMKERVGRATWTLLHTIAAEYPDPLPTEEYRRQLEDWLHLLPSVYPCEECAAHMKTMFEKNPPRTENQTAFGGWVCEVHNIVNERLGKPTFDCSTWRQTWIPLSDCHTSCKLKPDAEPW